MAYMAYLVVILRRTHIATHLRPTFPTKSWVSTCEPPVDLREHTAVHLTWATWRFVSGLGKKREETAGYGGFLSHGGTPSHPFLDGIIPEINHPAIG